MNNESGPTLSDLLRNRHGTVGKVGEPVSWPAESGGITHERALEAAQGIDNAPIIIGLGFNPDDMLDLASYLLGYDVRAGGVLLGKEKGL